MSEAERPKRKKFVPPRPPFAQMRTDQRAAYGVSMQHERLVGRVVMEWTRLEAVLNDLLWSFLGISFEDGRVLTGRTDASTLVSHLRILAPRHLVDEDKIEGLLLALDAVDAARDDRNFIVHGTWGRLEPEGVPLAMSLRSKSKPHEVTGETFPASRMRSIAGTIVGVRQMLVLLRMEIEESPESLLK